MSTHTEQVAVRRMVDADLDAVIGIAGLLREAPHWSPEAYAAAIVASSSRQRIALVAESLYTAEAVGFTIASLVPPEAELETIAVAPAMRRRNIGRQLLAALAGELRRASVADLWLEVRSSNRAAIRFYQAANFRETGIRPGYYADPVEDAILMTLRLV